MFLNRFTLGFANYGILLGSLKKKKLSKRTTILPGLTVPLLCLCSVGGGGGGGSRIWLRIEGMEIT